MTNLIRLNKFLAESGISSRRKADELILAFKVMVNDKIVTDLGIKIDPEKDTVKFENKALLPSKLAYYALYKPKSIISTAKDEQGRKTVVDLVPKEPRVFPVGRLDEESEGLIILTNDGELTQKLTHPSFEHKKEYEVIAKIKDNKSNTINTNNISKNIVQSFTKGIIIESKLMQADFAQVSIIHNTNYLIHLTLHTGYNRQIRKMCDKIGLEVISLKRVRTGKLRLDKLNLNPGEYKKITREMIT